MNKLITPAWITKKHSNDHGYPINHVLREITIFNIAKAAKEDMDDTLTWLSSINTLYKRKKWDATKIVKSATIILREMIKKEMKYKKTVLTKEAEKLLKPINHSHRWRSDNLSLEVSQEGRRHKHDTDNEELEIGSAVGPDDTHTHPVREKKSGKQLGFTSEVVVDVNKSIYVDDEIPESRRILSAAMGYKIIKAEYDEEEDPNAIKKLEKSLKNVPKSSKLAKANEDKRLVYAIVLEPEEVDSQKDIVSAEEIEMSAHNYLTTSRVIGLQHKAKTPFEVVESYIAPVNMTFKDGPFGTQKVKKGTWIIVIHVTDNEVWQMILDKKITGVSIGATGVRVPVS